MQVNKENIQRPSLIEPFFNLELSPTNEFIQYIDCSVKSSNVVHKKNNVTSNSHNTKKSLEKEYSRCIDNPLLKVCPASGAYFESDYIFVHSERKAHIFIKADYEQHIDYWTLAEDFNIFSPQSQDKFISGVI